MFTYMKHTLSYSQSAADILKNDSRCFCLGEWDGKRNTAHQRRHQSWRRKYGEVCSEARRVPGTYMV